MTSKAEREFCQLIAAAAMGMGLLVHWCPDSRKCVGRRGFPDLVIAGPGGLIFREVKMADGDTTADQDLWGWTLRSWTLGQTDVWTYEIWRPSDWDSGKIRKQLLELAGLASSGTPGPELASRPGAFPLGGENREPVMSAPAAGRDSIGQHPPPHP